MFVCVCVSVGMLGDRSVEVQYVDIGNEGVVSVSDLRKIKDEFFSLPAMVCQSTHYIPVNSVIIHLFIHSVMHPILSPYPLLSLYAPLSLVYISSSCTIRILFYFYITYLSIFTSIKYNCYLLGTIQFKHFMVIITG